MASAGWRGPSEGTAILWELPRIPKTEMVEVYWFATYVYGSVSIEIGENPDPHESINRLAFGDKSATPVQDEVYDWGMIGFGEEGYNPCNWSPQPGACCVGNVCYIVLRDECHSMGGQYGGDNTDCFPNPCDRPAVEIPWGLIKRLFR